MNAMQCRRVLCGKLLSGCDSQWSFRTTLYLYVVFTRHHWKLVITVCPVSTAFAPGLLACTKYTADNVHERAFSAFLQCASVPLGVAQSQSFTRGRLERFRGVVWRRQRRYDAPLQMAALLADGTPPPGEA